MITISSLAATYSSAVTYNAATGTTSTSDATASNTTAATTANPNGQLSAAVAAKVTQALAPATAGIKQLNTSLTQGQTKLSALGQVQSAIADFQDLAKNLGGTMTTMSTATGTAAKPATSAEVNSQVQNFVAAYNALNTKLQSLQSGDMKSDPGLAQVSAQMTQALRDAGGTSSTGALSKAGISLSGGKLTIDSAKLTAALAADPAGVAGLLSGNGNGVADKLSSKLGALTASGGAIGRETAATTKDISNTESKRATMTKTLTAQATALAALYTQQEQAGASGGATSLFDMMG
jgi:flagellar hook-associated protein 2